MDRFIGRIDVLMADGYRTELEQASHGLRLLGPGEIACSPISRALRCADHLCTLLNVPMYIDHDLAEADYGEWDGRTFAEIEALDPESARRFRQWDPTFCFPGGESIQQFVARCMAAARRLCDRPAPTVLAVTHGAVIRQIVCHLLGLSPRQHLLFDIRCSAVTSLDVFGDRGVLSGLNLCLQPPRCDKRLMPTTVPVDISPAASSNARTNEASAG